MTVPGPRVLLITDDDDVSEPLAAILARAGYRVEALDGADGIQELRASPTDVLILDRDLPASRYQEAMTLLEERAGAASFPLVIVGGGAEPALPRGWHEDAALAVARPPQPAEILASLRSLRRLAFYRLYRDLVHDLSQPVTSLHALSRMLARTPPADPAGQKHLDMLVKEADRLMSLLEDFQRKRSQG
jgi:DNA-binding response OmpR family regulator